jgi:hypothetical protein
MAITALMTGGAVTGALADDDGYARALDALRGNVQGVNVLPFDDSEIFFEINSTDDDAGVHMFFDGFAWKNVRVFNPEGRKILQFTARGEMRELGLTELQFESAEPDAETALDLFEDGTYIFLGRTIDGELLVGTAELTHEIAEAPEFTPEDGALVDPEGVVVEWDEIEDVETYQVIIESDDVEGEIDAILPSSMTSFAIPDGFLQEDTEYKIEVLAKLENGNQTLTENFVTTTGSDVSPNPYSDSQPTSSDMTLRVGFVRPNPFNPSTSIHFALPQGGQALVQVFDVQGQLVRTLVDEHMPAGSHEVGWNGRNDGGTTVGSGSYFVRVQSNGNVESRKLIMSR